MANNMLPLALVLIGLAAAAIAAQGDDNDGAPEFNNEAFTTCAKNAARKYGFDENSSGRRGRDYYVCHEDRNDKTEKVFGSFAYRELDNLENCYALAMSAELKMPEPHTIQAFEERYGLVEMLLRSNNCQNPNGPSVITNPQKLKMIKTTAWEWCQQKLEPHNFEDMKAFYVCRNYQPGQDLMELFNYILGRNAKAKPFEDCFTKAAADALGLTVAQYKEKYDTAMLVKSLKCSRVPAKPSLPEWKAQLSWLVKFSRGAFNKIADAVLAFIPLEERWECLQKVAPAESSRIGSIACSAEKRAKFMGCLWDPTKQQEITSLPANEVERKTGDAGFKQMIVKTILKPFRKLHDLMCGTGKAEGETTKSGKAKTPPGVHTFLDTTVSEFGGLLSGETRSRRSEGSRQEFTRVKRRMPDKRTVLGYVAVVVFIYPAMELAEPIYLLMLFLAVPHAGIWFIGIFSILYGFMAFCYVIMRMH